MDKDQMLTDLKDVMSFAGVNILGIVVSLSELEQGVRVLTGLAVLVYSIFKAAKMIRSYRNGQ